MAKGHSKNTSWPHQTEEGKLREVKRYLRDTDRYPDAIARDVGVSTATATKYLHMLVRQGRAIAEPELHRYKVGSTPRSFRLAKPGEDRPDMTHEPTATTTTRTVMRGTGYEQDDSNGTRSNRTVP